MFGCGVVARLGSLSRELGATRALLVTDRGIVAAGHVARAVESLRSEGLDVTVYDAVRENPTTTDVARCLEVARDAEVDLSSGWVVAAPWIPPRAPTFSHQRRRDEGITGDWARRPDRCSAVDRSADDLRHWKRMPVGGR